MPNMWEKVGMRNLSKIRNDMDFPIYFIMDELCNL